MADVEMTAILLKRRYRGPRHGSLPTRPSGVPLSDHGRAGAEVVRGGVARTPDIEISEVIEGNALGAALP